MKFVDKVYAISQDGSNHLKENFLLLVIKFIMLIWVVMIIKLASSY